METFIHSYFSYLAYFFFRTGLAIGIGFWILFGTKWGQNRRVFRIPYARSQFKREFWGNMKIIPYYTLWITALTLSNITVFSPPTLLNTLFTVVVIYWWNETWFYFLHRMIHKPKLYWIHRAHHESTVTNPMSFMVFSIPEQTLQILLSISLPAVLSHFVPISLEGLLIYGVFQLLVNLLGHMNVEVFPAGFARKGAGVFMNTPTYHALHHARMSGNYGMLTTVFDRWLGTDFPDYADIQERAASGCGLTRTSQRIPVTGKTAPDTQRSYSQSL